jgi:hypothetical protein
MDLYDFLRGGGCWGVSETDTFDFFSGASSNPSTSMSCNGKLCQIYLAAAAKKL